MPTTTQPPFARAWQDCAENHERFTAQLAEFTSRTQPAIDRAGITILGFEIDDNPNHYATCEFRGERFHMSASEFFGKGFPSFARLIEDVHEFAMYGVQQWVDPFYCNIHSSLRSRIGDDVHGRHLAFSYVCDVLRNHGIRIWS